MACDIAARPAHAPYTAARHDDMNVSPGRTCKRDAPSGTSRLRTSDQGRGTARLARSVADADRGEGIDLLDEADDLDAGLDDLEGGGRRGDGGRVREAQAAFVDLRHGRCGALAVVVAAHVDAEGAPQVGGRRRTAVAQERRMRQRLQEIERDRKQ